MSVFGVATEDMDMFLRIQGVKSRTLLREFFCFGW